jgi:hypothetical protein
MCRNGQNWHWIKFNGGSYCSASPSGDGDIEPQAERNAQRLGCGQALAEYLLCFVLLTDGGFAFARQQSLGLLLACSLDMKKQTIGSNRRMRYICSMCDITTYRYVRLYRELPLKM